MGDAIREIGRVTDMAGGLIAIGTDCDAVTIRFLGPARIHRLDAAGRDTFSRLYFEAERAAEAWAKAWTVGEPAQP